MSIKDDLGPSMASPRRSADSHDDAASVAKIDPELEADQRPAALTTPESVHEQSGVAKIEALHRVFRRKSMSVWWLYASIGALAYCNRNPASERQELC
jgi:hypothetical protein